MNAKNRSDAIRRIRFSLAEFEDDDQLAAMIFEPASQVDLAGQLMVHAFEVGDVDLRKIELQESQPSFLNLMWTEAVEAFKRRGIMDPNELSVLLQGYEGQGRKARQLVLEQMQQKSVAALEQAIAEGQTFRQYAQAMQEAGDMLGIGELDHNYLDTVFRTNVSTAYGAGRERAIVDPDVVAARPYWQYRTTDDGIAPLGRVRPNHQRLHMLVFRTGNAATDGLRPPGGFRCRCTAVTLSAAQAEGLEILEAVPPGGEPDEGWFRTPTQMIGEDA